MLPQRHRLKRRSDVSRVRRQAKAWRHPLAILLAIRTETQMAEGRELNIIPPTRFAFSASRHVGTAVTRNRGKRVLREAVREQLEHIKPGWDCLFIVRDATPHADYAAVQTAVSELLQRAHLLEPIPG